MEETTKTVLKWQDTITTFFIQYGIQIIGAMIIFAVGLVLARWLGKLTDSWLLKQKLEPPIRSLFVRGVRLVVMALVLVLVLDKFGVPIAPMIAGIGVAGVGIGLAMQGMLGNLVAGLTIIFTRPYRVGEYIQLLGVEGEVVEIQLFTTVLIHPDASRVVIPNRKIIGEILHNHGMRRQLDLNVGVAYTANLSLVVATVRGIVAANARVLKEPVPLIGIETLGESVINITVRPWVKVPDYVAAQLELYQALVEKFRAADIEMPFPQREVRLLGSGSQG